MVSPSVNDDASLPGGKADYAFGSIRLTLRNDGLRVASVGQDAHPLPRHLPLQYRLAKAI